MTPTLETSATATITRAMSNLPSCNASASASRRSVCSGDTRRSAYRQSEADGARIETDRNAYGKDRRGDKRKQLLHGDAEQRSDRGAGEPHRRGL